MRKFEVGTTIRQLFEALGEEAEEALLGLEPDGREGEKTEEVKGVGRVTYWLDACSEGADRGGYVTYVRLEECVDHKNWPILLEAETDGSELYFNGRMARITEWA
jgi:hypothetical protein